MKISFENSNQAKINNCNSKITKDIPDITEVTNNFNNQNLKGWYKEVCFTDYKIGYGSYDVINSHKIEVNFIGETIEMTFLLDGEFKVILPNNSLTYKSNEHNLTYYANVNRSLLLEKGLHHLVKINFSIDFFKKYFPDDVEFKHFKNQIELKQTTRLQSENLKITHKISLLLKDIVKSEWKNYYLKMHANATVLKLLLLQLHQIKQINTNQKSETIAPNSIVEMVKEFITKNYNKPLSLELLCKKFGTNEYTLKKDFKATYNHTVFGYIADLKMEKSKKLLIKNKLSISEVSEKIGYKNPQHFSTAFKKKYGVSPSKINSLY